MPTLRHHLIRRAVLVSVVSATLGAAVPAQAARADPEGRPWTWPMEPVPAIVEGFDPPQEQWGTGHRGLDLAGQGGQAVLAVDDGTVTYAGVLAGRGVVVVSHGTIRSTYEPVTATVTRGDRVTAGQPIGLLQGVRSHCLPAACLHLGARVGRDYLDPETLLGLREIRLKPQAGLGPPALLLPPL